MKVVVIGGSGLIGQGVVATLMARHLTAIGDARSSRVHRPAISAPRSTIARCARRPGAARPDDPLGLDRPPTEPTLATPGRTRLAASPMVAYVAAVGRTVEPLRQEDRLRLSAHRILHDLGDELRDRLIEKFHVADLDAGVHILEEGQSNARLFIVLRGAVSVKLPKQAGRVSEVKLATLGAGEVFGEYSVFDAQPVSAAVYAAESTRLAWLEKPDLDAFLAGHPEGGRRFYEGMLRLLVARLRAKNAELDLVTIG